jgi:hypothetical protein
MPKDAPHVATIQQRGDNTLVVYVQTDSFTPGQEVEVSVYLTQGNAYAAHYEKKRIPFPDPSLPFPDPSLPKQPAVLQVELPATELNADQVTVITRVAEVWPSVLQPDPKKMDQYKEATEEYPDQGLKAIWTYQDSEGKAPGDPESPPSGNGGGRVTALPEQ